MVPNFGWNFGLGWLVVILSFILMVFGIAQLVRMAPGERRSRPRESASDILKKRYAQGDITREEFEALKKDIQ